MNYLDLISKKKQYKYSANICFDLKDEEKLANFIPNVTTTEIIREYLLGIINGTANNHSRILYGSYGTGKSHLLTVLCAILGLINTSGNGFKEFARSIEQYDKDLTNDLRTFVKEDKPFLVVPVFADFDEFDKCISYSLKKELERNNIKICFKSYFDEARKLLKKWETGEESAKRIEEECGKNSIDLGELYQGLENYDSKSEKKFNDIFKGMTYGATFVSGTGNLIDNIELANETIKGTHKGIVFVFDEFGRYIEDFGETIKVKVVQDLAEFCDHGKFNNYLIMVSHKQLSMYTDKMKKESSEEWKKVEGRFLSTSINSKYDQCLSLIPYIIPKTKKWDSFKEMHQQELNELYNQGWDFKGFLLPPKKINKMGPFEGGYPLHPITLYSLDRLSKKVAQNERTFFTYLASDEEHSLSDQLKNMQDDRFHFVGLDSIFDYFEANIRAYKSEEIYAIYKKLQFAINKLGVIDNNEIQVKILKAMAVIYIISDLSVLTADKDTLINVIDEDKELLSIALSKLEKMKIVRYMRQYGYFDFLDSSIYDLDSMIDEKSASVTDDMAISILNEDFSGFVVYPYEYNSTFHMNRIFVPVFVQKQDLGKKTFFNSLPKFYDGVIAFVLDQQYDPNEYAKIIDIPERMVMLINGDSKLIKQEVKRYVAILYFYSKREELKKDDPTVEKELLMYLGEQESVVNDLIRKWRSISNNNVIPMVNDKVLNINSELELVKKASEIMFDNFSKTVIINNDLINKNVISGAIKQARYKAMNYVFNNENIYDNCSVLSPEHTVLRSVLSKTGISDDGTVVVQDINKLPNGTIAGQPVMHALNKYLKKCEKAQVNLEEIYSELKQAPYGLRDGYLPVLFAYALKNYQNVSLFFHGTERDYSEDELVKAIESPEDYSLYICDWNDGQTEYIESLEKMFGQFINQNNDSKNRLRDLLYAMNTHFASVSKAARTTDKYVSEITKQYRSIMSISYKNYNKFFFENLLQIDDDLQNLIVQISNIKFELESVVVKQYRNVERSIRDVLALNNTESIVKYISKKYEEDWQVKSYKAFDYNTNTYMEYMSSMNKTETDQSFVKDVAKMVTGFEIDYWSDSKIDDFEDEFTKIINQLENYQAQDSLNQNEMKIIIETGTDETRITQFDKAELSTNSQMMFNKIKATMDSFGQGISYEEKMQVVAKLLGEIMQ
ncbi:hypothetical protein [[Clostridium] fimetarium]|uniref:Uncharacterized protein n=1 Tax=[Clostridium] fimetarium TaxID=99656 RepID=A0A1I0NES2_9FIRM|nr:hypothetical protein [[Clostridium] fimetarium]SEV99915.1 hypothetical protein SAMN05421659_10354 [[Clostridium] fimetarium]